LTATANGAIKLQVIVPNDQTYMGLTLGYLRTWSLAFAIVGGMVLFSGFMIKTNRVGSHSEAAEKELAAIKKKYGARIVDASGAPPADDESITLNNFEGLISVADELGKPVVYFAPVPDTSGHVFCVLDGKTGYQYRLAPGEDIVA
jgi:hypothetical protein